jgi:TolB protein
MTLLRAVRPFVLCAATLAAAACDPPADPPPAEQRLLITQAQTGFDADIFSIRPDGSGAVRLTTDPHTDYCPRWSPNRRRIAFVSHRDTVVVGGERARPGALYVMDADGSSAVRIAGPNGIHEAGCPDWSPDGSRIVHSKYAADTGTLSLFLIRANGAGETRLTFGGGHALEPRWSPDGRTIAFLTVDPAGGRYELRTIGADGGAWGQLSSPCEHDVAGLSWSPDGTRIALTCGGDRESAVYVMRANGTSPVRISPPAGPGQYVVDTSPTWSPDGSRLAIARHVTGDELEVFTVDLSGGSPVRITHRRGFDIPYDWR